VVGLVLRRDGFADDSFCRCGGGREAVQTAGREEFGLLPGVESPPELRSCTAWLHVTGSECLECPEVRKVQFTDVLEFNRLEDAVLAYRRGDLLDPQWMDEEPARFIHLCNVVADTSKLVSSLQPQVAPDGGVYHHLNADAQGSSCPCTNVEQAVSLA